MRGISHSMEDEDLAAKVAWFRTLSPLERYEAAMQMLAMLQALQPDLGSREQDDDRRPSATVRIVEAPRR
ncbi:MAG: hypothetical protein H6747_01290 [Deltaproteobacteria bacterium]|nr:hypothetical protein [Deltaproteobacteria bacterium]